MLTMVDGLVSLIEAYLTNVKDSDGFALLEVDDSGEEVSVQSLGVFDTVGDALQESMGDYRDVAKLCDKDGDALDDVLKQVQFIAGRGRVERVVTFREAVCDDLTSFPVMVVSDPSVGELAAVTVESVPEAENDNE